MEADTSITIENNDDLESIISRIKSEGTSKLVIGSSFQSMPIKEGLYCTKYLEILSNQIDSIPEETFANNQNIESVTLSTSIKTISDRAFYGSSISQINLDNVNSIGASAFCNCINLQSVNLDQIQSLKSSCFANTSLFEVELTDNIQEIPDHAFYNCLNLTSFISNCNVFGAYSFYNCISLKIFKYDFKRVYYFRENIFSTTSIEEFDASVGALERSFHLNFPLKKLTLYSRSELSYQADNVKELLNVPILEYTEDSDCIFIYNSEVEQLITSEDPNYRCTIKIAGCPNLRYLPKGISTVVYVGDMPEIEEVDLSFCTYIDRHSFFNCPKLKRVIGWGDHDMFLRQAIFEQCPLIDINKWNDHLQFSEERGMFSDKYSPLQYSLIRELTINAAKIPHFISCKKLQKVVFVEGSSIESIPEFAFYNCEMLSEVQLCSSITSIPNYAFANTNISYLDVSHVETMDIAAFEGTPLKEILLIDYSVRYNQFYQLDQRDEFEFIERSCYLPQLEKLTIGSRLNEFETLFLNGPELKEIVNQNDRFVIIENVIYTANRETLYFYPGGLEAKEFTVPSFVRNIIANAFAFTKYLEKIIINSDVKFTELMFAYCTSVKTIEINSDIKILPKGCFAFCPNLTTIKFPESTVITFLDSHCFHGCISLERLTFNNQLEYVGECCFQECQSLVEVDLSRLYKIPNKCFKGKVNGQWNFNLGTNLKVIGEEAFMDSSITEFICPENLIFIEAFAFSNCTELTNFRFNDNIRRIGDCSFYNVGLTELFIPNSLVYINTTSFRNSTHIKFKFRNEGHPIYYVEDDCFMNRTGGLMFILRGKGSYFEIPSTVKMISQDVVENSEFSRLIINQNKSDGEFLIIPNMDKLCLKSSPNDCQLGISDINNMDRYAKEGEYEPTYKLNNEFYDDESFWHVDEEVTSTTSLEFLKFYLPFLENLRLYPVLHIILLGFVSILSVIIMILSIIVLRETHE